MVFNEITKFVNLSSNIILKNGWASIQKKQEFSEKEIRDALYEIEIKEVLKEINKNFTDYVTQPEIEEKLVENYGLYVLQLKKIQKFSSGMAEKVMTMRINQITQQLLHPTFMQPGWNDLKEDGNDSKNRNELEKKEACHPKHDPNLWNDKAYELFKYLFEEYYLPEQTNQKLIYIYFFIKEKEFKTDNGEYFVHATKDEYFEFLKETYKLFPTNKDKRNNYGKHEIIMNDHQQIFKNSPN